MSVKGIYQRIQEGNRVVYNSSELSLQSMKEIFSDVFNKPARMNYSIPVGMFTYTIIQWTTSQLAHNLSRYWIETYKKTKLVQLSIGKKHSLYKILTNKEGSFYSVRYGTKEVLYTKDFITAMKYIKI